MELNILDKTSLKGISVWDNAVGYKTPRFLMSRELTGAFLKGDVLDANATAILIEEISGSGTHGDVKKYCDEQIQKLRDEMAQPLGFATLDATGNVPLTQLGNIDTNLYEIVTSLPAVGKSNKIYLIKDTTAPDKENVYYEWCYVDNAWEKMGEVHEDLTGYLKKTQSADDLISGKPIISGGTMYEQLMDKVTCNAPIISDITITQPAFHFASAYAPLVISRTTVKNDAPLFSGFDYKWPKQGTWDNDVSATRVADKMYAYALYMPGGDQVSPSMHSVGGGLGRWSTTGLGWGYGMNEDKTKPYTKLDWKQLSLYNEAAVLGINGFSFADRTAKDLPSAQNTFIHIGSPDDTTDYTNVCPIVQDADDTTKWYIPDAYLSLKDYAVRDEANTFTADNTFEGAHAVKFNTGAVVKAGERLSLGEATLVSGELSNEKACWSDGSKTGTPEVDITADKIHFEADLQGNADLTMTDLTFNKQMDDTYWTYKYGMDGVKLHGKSKKDLLTADESTAYIGKRTDATDYDRVCPLVNTSGNPEAYHIPENYIDDANYAKLDAANEFTKDNTFDGALNAGSTLDVTGKTSLLGELYVAGEFKYESYGSVYDHINMYDDENTSVYGTEGITIHGLNSRDLLNGANGSVHIGDPSEIADYKYVAPLEEYKLEESGPTYYRVPALYLDTSYYALLDAENKFTAANTFTNTVTVGDVDTTGAATTTITGGVVQTDTGTALKTDGLRMNCGKIVGWSDNDITKTPRIAITGNLFGTLRTRPNVVYGANDAILQLENYGGTALQKFTPSGIALNGKTNQYLFNCGGSTSKLGGTDDTNTYTNVAPLESYTKADDTTGWRIPADYIDVDHSKYAVLAEANTFTEENFFDKPVTIGAEGKTEIGDGELYVGDNVGLKEEGLKMTSGSKVGWGVNTSATPRVYITGTDDATLKTVSNVVYGDNSAMLSLDDGRMKFTPSGISLSGKTDQQLFNGAGSMTKLGSTEDTTSYTMVAPLESYTKDDSTTGYRVPAQYIDSEDFNDYLKKTQSADVITSDILSGGTLSKSFANVDTISAAAIKGTTTNAAPLLDVTIEDDDTWLARTAVIADEDKDLNNVTLNDDGIYVTNTTTAGTQTSMFDASGLYLDGAKSCMTRKGTVYLPTSTGSVQFGSQDANTGCDTKLYSLGANAGLATLNRSSIADDTALLNLNEQAVIYPKGIQFANCTPKHLLNMYGGSVYIGNYDDDTTYERVAPLVEKTSGSGKYYVPAEYLDIDDSNYAKLNATNNFNAINIFNDFVTFKNNDVTVEQNLNVEKTILSEGEIYALKGVVGTGDYASDDRAYVWDTDGTALPVGKPAGTTKYTAVAPLVQDSTDTTKYYVPEEYIQFSGDDFLKKTQSADDVTTTVFSSGTATAPLYDCNINTTLVKGVYNNDNPVFDVTLAGTDTDGLLLSKTAVAVADGTTGTSYVKPGAITQNNGSVTLSMGDGEISAKTSLETKFRLATGGLRLPTGSAGLIYCSDTELDAIAVAVTADTSGGIQIGMSAVPGASTVLLNLSSIWKFTKSGATLSGKSTKDLLNAGGSTVYIGKSSDTTAYTAVAPLVQDTTDTSKWYVPSEYIQGGDDDYLKKTQSGDDITATVITGGALGYPIVSSTYTDSVISGTTTNAKPVFNVASNNGYNPWYATEMSIYADSDSQSSGHGLHLLPDGIYATKSANKYLDLLNTGIEFSSDADGKTGKVKINQKGIQLYDNTGSAASYNGHIRFMTSSDMSTPQAQITAQSGCVCIDNMTNPSASSSLLRLRTSDSSDAAATTTCMITSNGIWQTGGTAKQLYTRAGGSATIGTTSDTTSYTSVAPLNSSGYIPMAYHKMYITTMVVTGTSSGGTTFQAVFSFYHTAEYPMTTTSEVLNYTKKLYENKTTVYLRMPASGTAYYDSRNWAISDVSIDSSGAITLGMRYTGSGSSSSTGVTILTSSGTSSYSWAFYTAMLP